MFLTLDPASLTVMPSLRRSMFMDRARQFVERHGWQLRRDEEGLEIDEYDDESATYCVIAGERLHRASVRLRPSRGGSMVEHHFPNLWRESLRDRVEITRFCASTSLEGGVRATVVSELLLGLCRHCQVSGIGSIYGVVFPPVARVIRQAGWDGDILARADGPEGTLLLVEWTPSALVAWTIQERLEAREAALAAQVRPVEAARLAA